MGLRKRKFSLKYKIAFAFMLLVVIVMATVTYFFTIRELGLRVNEVELRMERLANNIASIRAVETEDWSIYQTVIDNQIRLNPDVVYIAILDENEILQAHSLNPEWIDLDGALPLSPARQAAVVRQLMQGRIAEESRRDFASKSVNIMMGGRDSGTVRVGFSLIELNNDMLENLHRNLRLGLIFLVLAVLMSYVISGRIIKPLQKLTGAMRGIPAGELDQEMHIGSNDEIGEMAETFNFVVHGLREKKVIEDFSRDLGSGMDLKAVCRMIRDRIIAALQADSGILLIRDRDKPIDFHLIEIDRNTAPGDAPLICDASLYRILSAKRNRVIELAELNALDRFYPVMKSRFQLHDSAVLAPMLMQDACLGIFVLQRRTVFDANEKYFLHTLIQQGVLAIENALLLEEQAEKERLKRELEIARSVQQSLLPHGMPHVRGADIHGCCVPAAEIGGDYFDFFELEDGKLGMVIADVTGKGASAAFYMAVVKGLMLSLSRLLRSPKTLLCEINRRLWNQMDRKIFITMIYGIFDPADRRYVFSRAGHNGVIVKSEEKGGVFGLAPKGIGLGLESGPIFDKTIEEEEIRLQSGDSILLFTDGAFEARNREEEEFGEQRLMACFEGAEGLNAAACNTALLKSISAFSKETVPHDDITLITLRIL